ncbi:response regulator transcription factor [Nocardioides anomalus]|uniref:Response regulator transcription factor n=1 Tax=Nocardioides anomalus TaxID=2712223 RepID=A0A6G6WFT2_9ACTN|nr:response regulator [Nocardioides anomalus]QIG44069.1 response regulator transcription factor [Nocardioides anomalus]
MTVPIAVADDDERFRAALVDLLEADGRFDVVGAVGDGAELLRLHAEHRPRVVVLDVRMPGGGAAAAAALGAARPAPLVVVVSADTGTSTVAELLRAGAVAYLAKDRLGPDLGEVVSRVLDGEVVIGTPNAARVVRRLADASSRDA